VKIDPDVPEETREGRLLRHAFFRRRWAFSDTQIQFKNTAFTALTAGEEALFRSFKGKWRYNVRLARRRGITVSTGDDSDLTGFYALYEETGLRDGFRIRQFDYYRHLWQTFLTAQKDCANPAGGTLLLARHPDENRAVAGLFVLRYGAQAWYFHGASSNRRRRDMPNYLLQWEALRWSISQGCTVYDWWGAPDDVEDPEDPLASVWRFKQGFGPEYRCHVGAWDFPVSPPAYVAYSRAASHAVSLAQHLG
jgi:lipid II:glycine glycyltransferase (peptidoglycan interpeptide bridge formation enzyme)